MSGGQSRFAVRIPGSDKPGERALDVRIDDGQALRLAIRALLERVAVSAQDSRELAGVVVLKMPPAVRAVSVHEFLRWIRGSNDRLVAKYMRAGTIVAEHNLGELTGFQRAALIGALRLEI